MISRRNSIEERLLANDGTSFDNLRKQLRRCMENKAFALMQQYLLADRHAAQPTCCATGSAVDRKALARQAEVDSQVLTLRRLRVSF